MKTISVNHWMGKQATAQLYFEQYEEEIPEYGWLLEAYDELEWFFEQALEGGFDILLTGNTLWIDVAGRKFRQR